MIFGINLLLVDLYQVCMYDAPGVKTGQLEHRNKEGKLQNYSLKLEDLELCYLVYNISLWTSTKFVHMRPLGSKLAPSRGSQVEI